MQNMSSMEQNLPRKGVLDLMGVREEGGEGVEELWWGREEVYWGKESPPQRCRRSRRSRRRGRGRGFFHLIMVNSK